MNERTARAILLVKAIEEADQQREVLTEDDRKYASRTARELAHWQAAETRSQSTFNSFLFHRAEQLLKRLSTRHKLFAGVAKGRSGLWGASLALPLLALIIGAVTERIVDPLHVDLLSMPLLLIILWNFLAYALVLLMAFLPARFNVLRNALANRMALGGASLPRRLPHLLASGTLQFVVEWTRLSARLNMARIARILHWSAAAFALGAMFSLYAHGVLRQYAAGWESTFLDASEVHALLSLLFAPAIKLFGLKAFTLQEVAALHFDGNADKGSGAPWVHLYAASLLLYVIVPRLLLGSLAAVRAMWLRARFPLDLQQPYFRRLAEAAGAEPGLLRVLPYSFAVDEARSKGLEALARQLLGSQARVRLLPPAAYGSAPAALEPDATAMTAVLFNLGATPERENHGFFLAALARGKPVTALLDQSSLAARVDLARLRERVELWREFCILHGAEPVVVDLLAPHPAKGEPA